jgi:hypothetical protein
MPNPWYLAIDDEKHRHKQISQHPSYDFARAELLRYIISWFVDIDHELGTVDYDPELPDEYWLSEFAVSGGKWVITNNMVPPVV